ncbi:MAG: hypothetical protein ACTHJT_15790 [Cytophaga sp.]|uniref:hypothetical protein n=1 Tax=Cytophaga sp. TaxID=29535 RepID=UPI003F7DD135
MSRNLFLCIALFFTVTVYGQSNAEVFDYGTFENNVYTNSYFNLKIDVPPTWKVHSKEQTDTIISKAMKKMTDKDATLKPLFNPKDIKDAVLIMANQYRIGAAVDFNPGFVIMAENIMDYPEIETEAMYLGQVKKLLLRTKSNYVINDKISKEKFNGVTFYKFSLSLKNAGSVEIKQTYYSLLKKGFSLGIVTTYNTKAQKKELDKILKTLQISN